jgi:thiol-disulfide isomerase/thioredoxin
MKQDQIHLVSQRQPIALIGSGLMVGVGLGLVILVAFGALLPSAWRPFGGAVPLAPEVSKPAPDFRLSALDGKLWQLKRLQGHPLLINFWATWCQPCRQEMPMIEKYSQRYHPRLEVLAVNDGEATPDVQRFVNELRLTFNILLDPDVQVTDLYRIRAFPTTIFVDDTGVIRFQHVGSMTEDQLNAYLKKIGADQ